MGASSQPAVRVERDVGRFHQKIRVVGTKGPLPIYGNVEASGRTPAFFVGSDRKIRP
jgi:hypothetical protein